MRGPSGRGARVHGGLLPAEAAGYGGGLDEFLDFSANLNPFGPPAAVIEAAARCDLRRYPDPECIEVRKRLARVSGVSPRELLVASGSSELFHLLARASLHVGDAALVFAPAFGEYRTALEAAGASVHEFRAEEEDEFRWDMDAALAFVRRLEPAIVVLGLPNNPTGTYTGREQVMALARAIGEGVLILDEAYHDFVPDAWDATRMAPNVAVVRSLTKSFSIPGLRIGYLAAPLSIVEAARRQQPSWSVSAPAQAAALACLDETAFLSASVREVANSKRWLVEAVRAAAFAVVAGKANFILIKTGDAAAARARLLRRRIAVRDCTSFGLPDHIRVAVRSRGDCEQLVEALVEARGDG